jgi:hypothetical protein
MGVPRKVLRNLRRSLAGCAHPRADAAPGRSPQELRPGISVSDREFLLSHGIAPPSEPQSGGEEPVGAFW